MSAGVSARAQISLSAQFPVESVLLAAPEFILWDRDAAASERTHVVRRSTRVLASVLSLPPLGTSVLKPHLHNATPDQALAS